MRADEFEWDAGLKLLGWLIALAASATVSGCYYTLEPGHAGLLFDPHTGLQREVLNAGRHRVGVLARIEDFDVTYSTKKEEIKTQSSEGLNLDVKLEVRYRPILSELYALETEVGPNYYDEVISPEFRSAARGTLAHHSYLELQKVNEKIEDEIEAEVRRRINGKHLEISSITLEQIDYAPEIAQQIRSKLVGEQEEARRRAAREWEKQAQQFEVEKAKAKAEALTRDKENERKVAEQQAAIDKLKAQSEGETQVTRARAAAEEAMLLAKAHAEENRAQSTALTPLAVQMHAYDALAKLGGTGTTIMLGDWSHVPNFLFPRINAFQGTIPPGGAAEKTVSSR